MKKRVWFPSSDGRTMLHGIVWEPEGRPRAIVQIAHGMSEYAERYEGLAAYLTARGFLVAGHDHLGHGDSVFEESEYGYFAKGQGERCVLQDLHRMTLLLQRHYPNIPHFLFGHSMGSFLARRFLSVYPYETDGAILCGTGWQPDALLWAARGLTAVESAVFGEHHRSRLVDGLAFGAMNRSFQPVRTPKDWLCRDSASVDRYIADTKCSFVFTLNGYRGLFRTIAATQEKRELAKMEKSLPVLFISGDADPVGDFGRGVKRAVQAFHAAGMQDVECILYPECRHELINEWNKREIFRDILEWLQYRI